MCSQFRWVNQILFFVIAQWIQSALHLSCAANLCALLEGEFCCQLKIIWTVALGQKVSELERKSPFSQNLPSHYALVVPFPPHWVASVQECFNWGVLTSPHFERDSIDQQHPLTLPHWVSWWACARRFSWESCHSSLTLQWLLLGKLQTAAQWNGTVWFRVLREKQLWNFVKDP